jgi:antitoxin VapB
MVMAGMRGGLHVALTRMVAVGALPRLVEERFYAATQLSSICMANARVGQSLGEGLRLAMSAFQDQRYPSDWRVRFRADVLDFSPHESHSSLHTGRIIEAYQPLAWSASINGVQSEDTCLVLPDQTECLTSADDWPVVEVEVNHETYYRPDILRL